MTWRYVSRKLVAGQHNCSQTKHIGEVEVGYTPIKLILAQISYIVMTKPRNQEWEITTDWACQ